MAGSITAANAIVTITVPGVFQQPQQLQQFAADDIFDTEAVKNIEVQMGVDGFLSGGWVNVPIPQSYSLQANSPSCNIFDQWWSAQSTLLDAIAAFGVVTLPSIAKKWALSNGFLTTYPPMPGAGRILRPRKFEITWQRVLPQPYTP